MVKVIKIEDSIHKKLKVESAVKEKTMKKIIEDALEKYFKEYDESTMLKE